MKSKASEAIVLIEDHARTVKEGRHETVKPGQPFSFNPAHEVGEGVWQGDLGIAIIAGVPDGYDLVKKPTTADRKLVPGSEDGAKHHLDSFDGVKLYHPKGWGKDMEMLAGPVLVVSKPRQIVHSGSGQHGTVGLCEGNTYGITYQRVWENEEARERRSRD